MTKTPRLSFKSLIAFLEVLPNEAGDILDGAGEKDGVKKCVPLVLNSLQALTHDHFDYLPVGERDDIISHCGTWLSVGMLIGAAPEKVKALLIQSRAKVLLMKPDEPESDGTAPESPAEG